MRNARVSGPDRSERIARPVRISSRAIEPGRVRRCIALLVCVVGLASAVAVIAQERAGEQTRTVTAATRDYRTSGINRWLRGSDYRELWLQPIEVPVLDLEAEGGGLTPRFTVGDGRGLALVGADGRSYTFRAVDKDLARNLPESWYFTLPAHLVQDQTTADHPAANIIVPHLADALGILHTQPRLVVMPESDRLGEFADEFAGRLGTIEVFPTPRSDDHAGFHGATEILDTAEMWARMLAGDGRPDARALLRARLLDILVGDWDRHFDQFRWARIPGQEHWQPIPEDHDHALSNYEGFALSVARTRWPRLVLFRDRIDQLHGLNEKGHEVDRWVLSGLSRQDFLEAARDLAAALPDPVIDAAVRTMPVEYHALNAASLSRVLRSRRDDLVRAADEFYEDLAREVELHGTDLEDRFEVDRTADGTRVRVASSDGENRLERTFSGHETRRVRLHLHGGADSVTVHGRPNVDVAVIAGPGPDRLTAPDAKVRVFDIEAEDTVAAAPGSDVAKLEDRRLAPDGLPWEVPRDRGTHRYPVMWSSIEPDSSLFLGAGIVSTRYDLRTDPFAARHELRGGFSIGRLAPRFEYRGTFHRAQSNVFFGVDLDANGLARLNYHGIGNETVRGDDPDDFFEARGREIGLGGTVNVQTGNQSTWSIGARLARFTQSDDHVSLLALERPYGFGPFWDSALTTSWSLDTRQRVEPAGPDDWRERDYRVGDPYTGLQLRLRADVHPPMLDVESWFGGVDGFVTGYLPLAQRLTLAARVGGRHVWGDFPWQASAFIGGEDNVRGYRAQRFAGRSSLYGNLELRYTLRRAKIIVPGELGVFVLGDVGRVWADDEDSDAWHPAVGGGFFFVLPELETAFHLGMAVGSESPKVHLGVGFGF